MNRFWIGVVSCALVATACSTKEEGVAASRYGFGARTNAYQITLEDGFPGWTVSGSNTAAVMRRSRELCRKIGFEVMTTNAEAQTRRPVLSIPLPGFRYREVVTTIRCRRPTP